MRSDSQLDMAIDVLLARVRVLEIEVARLKGEALPAEIPGVPANPETQAPPEVTTPEQRPAAVTKKPPDSNLENAIGTRWIGRVGVVAILFGVAFFLKYSFDNKLIGETGRVVLGIFWGAVFIAAGEYFQKRKNLALYGQMLSGGGLAVLYLALYAAFALYHLIPAPLATAGMLAVTSAGMTLSVRYSAYSLAAIALLGGFLTPIMLSTGRNQPLTLFGYILLLDAGTLLLMRFRKWPSLVAASLLGTALLYGTWHAEYFSDDQRRLAFGVVALFFIFYNLHVLASRIHFRNREEDFDMVVVVGSVACFFLAFLAQQRMAFTWPIKSLTLVLAGVEIGLAELVRRRGGLSRLTVAAYVTMSVVLTVAATFIALEQRWIMPALAAEMAALAWIGFRLGRPALRWGAYLLGALVIGLFTEEISLYLEPFERFVPVFNGRFLVCAAAVAGFYALLAIVRRRGEKLQTNEQGMMSLAFIASQVLSLALLSAELHDFFRYRTPGMMLRWGANDYAFQLSLSVLWAAYASLLTGVGIFRRLRGVRVLGILLLGVTVLKVFLLDLSALRTVYRIISFIVLGLLLLAVSYGYNRFRHLIFGEDQP